MTTTTQNALARGRLHSIPTESTTMFDCGIEFLVRKVDNLAEKDKQAKRALDVADGQAQNTQNPFLPYEKELYVGHVSNTHVCLLNKFNVVADHILLVTTKFEHQDRVLTIEDFHALAFCLAEFDCLGFYNGGRISGASQPHKHLQVVPLPLSPNGPSLPLDPAIQAAKWFGAHGNSSGIPFPHFLARPPSPIGAHGADPASRATTLHDLYRDLLEKSPVTLSSTENGLEASPYNLLITRNWMMLVPRTREFFGSISLNALAFAGALLVRTEAQQEELRAKGCAAALKHVTT